MDHIERCKGLVHTIQNLEHTEMIELFKMLHNSKCEYMRNNNGVFINLSWISEDMLTKIEKYVAFCNKSRNEVQKYESLCDVLNKNIHDQKEDSKTNGDSEVFCHYATNDANGSKIDKRTTSAKVSSSMRFYLLKKRYSKQIPMLPSSLKNDLSYEQYVL